MGELQGLVLRDALIHLPRQHKRLILALNDFCVVELCLLLAFYVRLGWWPPDILAFYMPVFIITPLCVLAFFYQLSLYSLVTRYTGVEVLTVLARGVSYGVLVVLLIFYLASLEPPLPRSVLLLFWVFSILALFSSRLVAGKWLHGTSLSALVMSFTGLRQRRKARGQPVAIYGAGAAGQQLVAALQQGAWFTPLAFIDDDPVLQGETVNGLKVYGPAELPEFVSNWPNLEVLLALPSVGRHQRQEIIRFLETLDVHVRSVPSLDELAQGQVRVEDIREVDVADILGRDAVPADKLLLEHGIRGRVILVTGAGGSIGSELCRQLLRYQPARLLLVDHSEFSLYTIFSELEDIALRADIHVAVTPIIGSVADGELLRAIFAEYKVDTLYHAAAYKHVTLVEDNGYQGFVNNVMGTLMLARAAMEAGVGHMVLVSTDKAVRPTNLMGATKRLAELVLQAFCCHLAVDFSGLEAYNGFEKKMVANNTTFTMVRFGNVLDSSGSVIPRFRKQIRAGGPVTVTHKDITRYFMTIPEAAELVLQVNGLSEGGDVFILDMGKPVKIDDLARKLIHLSGLSLRNENNPDGDIEIQYTGMRPGEKLYEELLIDDSALPTRHPKIWRANERDIPWEELKPLLLALADAFRAGATDDIARLLARPEIGYRPSEYTKENRNTATK